jgi:hypothetical protein
VSLLASSVSATAESFDAPLNSEQLAEMPADLVAELRAAEGDIWTRGITYLPENQSTAVARALNDYTTVQDVFEPSNEARVEADPFLIITKFTCAPFGWQSLDWKGRAVRHNALATPAAIGKEFWTGTVAQAAGAPTPYLTKEGLATDLTPTPGTPVSVIEALGILQDYLRQGVGAQGMIHLIPRATPSLLNVRRVGKFMMDEFDNYVVPDVGYTGSGPIDNEYADITGHNYSWMFASDLVTARQEPGDARVFPDTMAEAIDWGQNSNPNTVTFYAERVAMAYFDCFRCAAVLVANPT